MLHIVEIALGDYELKERMSRMREWLDRNRYEPIGFRQLSRTGVTICRIDFTSKVEAGAFAQAFGGCLISALAA